MSVFADSDDDSLDEWRDFEKSYVKGSGKYGKISAYRFKVNL